MSVCADKTAPQAWAVPSSLIGKINGKINLAKYHAGTGSWSVGNAGVNKDPVVSEVRKHEPGSIAENATGIASGCRQRGRLRGFLRLSVNPFLPDHGIGYCVADIGDAVIYQNAVISAVRNQKFSAGHANPCYRIESPCVRPMAPVSLILKKSGCPRTLSASALLCCGMLL